MKHSPQAGFPTITRAGRRLVLLLALAACGGEGQGDAPAARGDAAQAAEARLAKGPAGNTCTAPSPAVNPALLNDTTPWATLTAWRQTAGVAFTDTNPDSSRAWVRLCAGCQPVKLRIVSESRTYCNTAQNLLDSTRIAGVWAVEEGSVTVPNWGVTFNPGDSIFVFARDTAAPAVLAYPVGNNVHLAPEDAWSFRYCQDGHPGNRPQGKWRNPRTNQTVFADDDDVGSADPPGTYGWMACASGCCQFYIPPIMEELGLPEVTEKAKGNLPDSLPAGGRPVCQGRP